MFSIIIPTLNNQKYLEFCINSIKKNSKLNNEILVQVRDDFDKTTRNDLRKNRIEHFF